MVYYLLKSYLENTKFLMTLSVEKRSTKLGILDIINQIQVNVGKKLWHINSDLQRAFVTVNNSIWDTWNYKWLIWLISWRTKNLVDLPYILKDVNKIGPRNISSKEILLPVFPQGSILGPLLFLIYLNGISSTIWILYLFVHDRNLWYANKDLK